MSSRNYYQYDEDCRSCFPSAFFSTFFILSLCPLEFHSATSPISSSTLTSTSFVPSIMRITYLDPPSYILRCSNAPNAWSCHRSSMFHTSRILTLGEVTTIRLFKWKTIPRSCGNSNLEPGPCMAA